MKKLNMQVNYSYRVGGSLAWNDATYVRRQADRDLYDKVLQGQFCYVLGPRQTGKSSLRIRTNHHLEQVGYRALSIQATQIDSHTSRRDSESQIGWHEQLIASIWDALYPQEVATISSWLEATARLSGEQRLEHFTRDLLFPELLAAPMVIFIDEIDYLLNIPAAVSDLLSWIETCYRLQANRKEYQSLDFVIMGSTTTRALVSAIAQPEKRKRVTRTLFSANGKIVLDNFKLSQTAPLQTGFINKLNPSATLKAILSWTNGQPFLTQKICQMVASQTNTLLSALSTSSIDSAVIALPTTINSWIEQIVRANIIQDWLLKDDPVHLREISKRLQHSPRRAALMTLYRRILTGQRVACNGDEIQQELIMIGLVLCHNRQLHVANKIYLYVFGGPKRQYSATLKTLPTKSQADPKASNYRLTSQNRFRRSPIRGIDILRRTSVISRSVLVPLHGF